MVTRIRSRQIQHPKHWLKGWLRWTRVSLH
nr:MAG TPA: hypothetical protein [Caudoviricetes sp.]